MTQLGNYSHNGFEHMLRELIVCTRGGTRPELHMGDVLQTQRLLEKLKNAVR